MCKPWKANGHSKQRHDAVRFSDYRRKVGADTAVAELMNTTDAPAWADYWEQEEAIDMENEFVLWDLVEEADAQEEWGDTAV